MPPRRARPWADRLLGPRTARRDRPGPLPDPPRRGSGGLEPSVQPRRRWLAYSRHQPDHSGSPVVVPAAGGPGRSPLGAGITTWWWAPSGATLYGVNQRGQLLRAQAGGGGGRLRVLAGGATSFADAAGVSPDGRQVVTDSSGCIPPGFALDTV